MINCFSTKTDRAQRPLGLLLAPATAALLCFFATPAVCRAQSGDLRDQLKNLNVRHGSDHYILAGTVSDSRLDMYGNALEYIYREYKKGFTEVLKDREKADRKAGKTKKTNRNKSKRSRNGRSSSGNTNQDIETRTMDQDDELERFPVIVFNNRQEYEQFGRAYLGGAEHSIGMYIPTLKLLIIQDQGNFEDTTEVLFHEAFHQFMHRYVKNPPMWLNEGLAVHYGYGSPTSGGLSFKQPPAIRWQLTRKVIQKNMAIPLWDVVSADRGKFYSTIPVNVPRFERVTRQSLYYAEAYTLVHTLLSDQSGRERLRNYLRDLSADDGTNTATITREYFSPEICEHMTSFWIKHVNSRPETR